MNDVHEWTVQVLLTGDFETAHTVGDNSQIVATDTMKNTVYSLARWSSATTMEDFAKELIDHFCSKRNAQVRWGDGCILRRALWKRLTVDGKPHPDTFMRGSNEVQTATVAKTRGAAATFQGGFKDLNLLKTANSAFWGFQRDELTTLPETKRSSCLRHGGMRRRGSMSAARWTFRRRGWWLGRRCCERVCKPCE